VLGIGLDLLLVSHALLPLDENTPLAVLIGSTILGLIVGLAGRRRGGGEPEAPTAASSPPSPPTMSAPEPPTAA